jgi:hypothetical protein
VGTPLPWFDKGVAAGGRPNFEVEANGVILVVDEVLGYSSTPSGIPASDGYVFVVIKMRVSNRNWIGISSLDFVLVDASSNQYTNRSTVGFESLPAIGFVEHDQVVAGALVFEVPTPALQNSLRLRLEPQLFKEIDQATRIEIFLDTILLQS